MFNIITKEPLVGQELQLTKNNVKNWDDLLTVVADEDTYHVTIIHANKIQIGKLVRYQEKKETKYALLMDRSVVLPDGICIKVDIDEPTQSKDCQPCCTDKKVNLSDETRFAVLDSSGCITGYVTLSDIISNVAIPTLCDLFPTAEERNGDLTSQDRILTISGKCNIKAVKQSDIKCK